MAQNDVNVKINVDASQAQKQSNELKTKLRELKTEMENLAVAGKENTAEFKKVQAEYASLVDLSGDLSAAARVLADDYFKQTAAMEGLAVGVNIFSGITQAAALCGAENEDLQKVLVKLQAAQNLANVAMNIAKALNKDTALMTALNANKTNALTAAQTKNTASTTAAATATAGFTAAEGAATTASGALTVGIKAVGTAIKSIPVIGWILAAIAALTTLITLIVSANKEEEEGVQIQKMKEESLREQKKYILDATKSVESQSLKLKYNAQKLKECKENSDEWNYYAEQVSNELGISKVWLEKNKDRVDDLVEAWTKLKVAQATADAAAQKMADNNIRKEEILLELQKIQNMEYDDRKDKLKEMNVFTSQEIDVLNKAMHDSDYIYKEGNATFTTTDAILRQMTKHAQERLDADNKTYKQIIDNQQDIITNNDKIVDDAKTESQTLQEIADARDKSKKSVKDTSKETADIAARMQRLNEEIDKLSEEETEITKITNKYNSLIQEAVDLYGAESDQVKTLTKLENDELAALNKKTKALEEHKKLSDAVLDAETETLKTGLQSENLLNKKIDLLKAQRQLELDNTELTESEKANIVAKYQKQIDDLKKDYNQKSKDAELETAQATANLKLLKAKEGSEEYITALKEQATAENAIELEALVRRKEEGEITEEQYTILRKEKETELQNTLAEIEAEAIQRRNEARFAATENIVNQLGNLTQAMMDAELEAVGNNEKKQRAIKQKYAKMNFASQIAAIGIDTAKGIMSVWSTAGEAGPILGPILGAVQTALIIGTGIAQTIKAKNAMNEALSGKAARGAFVNGRSHLRGGELWELEGGEAVLNKKAMAIPAFRQLASAMNEATGGVSFNNTITTQSQRQSLLSVNVPDDAIRSIVAETVAGIVSIPVTVTESSITNAQRNVSVIENRSSF